MVNTLKVCSKFALHYVGEIPILLSDRQHPILEKQGENLWRLFEFDARLEAKTQIELQYSILLAVLLLIHRFTFNNSITKIDVILIWFNHKNEKSVLLVNARALPNI